MKTVLISLCLLGLTACGNTKKIKGNGEGQTIEFKKVKKLEPASISEGRQLPENFVEHSTIIDSAYIDGNTLVVKVHYTGGCEEHLFTLTGRKAISKSLPPIRSIYLNHSGKADSCQATIIKTLQFDISNLAYKQEEGSEIKLSLKDYKEQLLFTYSTK